MWNKVVSAIWVSSVFLTSPAVAQDMERAAEVTKMFRLEQIQTDPPLGRAMALTEDDLTGVGAAGTTVSRLNRMGSSAQPMIMVEWTLQDTPVVIADMIQLLPTDDPGQAIAHRIAGLPIPLDAVSRKMSLGTDLMLTVAPDDHLAIGLKGDVLILVRSFGPAVQAPALVETLMKRVFESS